MKTVALIAFSIACGSMPAFAGSVSYVFDFAPTSVLPVDATFSYVDSMATGPGTAIAMITATPEIGLFPQVHGDRRLDGSWLFTINPIDPHVTYTFIAYTDLSFPNSAGKFTVPSDVSFAGICIPCPPSGPDRSTVTITISDVPEAGSLLLLATGLMALAVYVNRHALISLFCGGNTLASLRGPRASQQDFARSKPPAG